MKRTFGSPEKVVCVRFSAGLFTQLFTPSRYGSRCLSGLPEGAELCYSTTQYRYESDHLELIVVYTHETFTAVEPGEEIPEITVIMKSIRDQEET